jgi:hypothetical protein
VNEREVVLGTRGPAGTLDDRDIRVVVPRVDDGWITNGTRGV